MIAWMSVSAGPTGTVSPGAYDTGLGPFGVSAIAASPKMPTGFTLATEFFGTFTSSFDAQHDVEIAVVAQLHVGDAPDVHAGEQHRLPRLEVLPPRELRVERIARTRARRARARACRAARSPPPP